MALPLGVVQLVLSTLLHVTLGGVVVEATIDEHVAVQLEVVLVTVTVYVPALKLLIAAVVPPLLHK